MTDEESRLLDLENQVTSLRRTLDEQNALNRKSRLEDEVADAHTEEDNLTKETDSLHSTIKRLQWLLIEAESAATAEHNEPQSSAPEDNMHSRSDSVIYAEERAKQLELMYIQAKKDKEKATRLLIQLIGKNKVADFLDDNTGGADLIDRLHEGVMSRHLKMDISADSEYSGFSPNKRPSRNASQSSQRSNSNSSSQGSGGGGLSPIAAMGRLSISDEKSPPATKESKAARGVTPTKSPITTKSKNDDSTKPLKANNEKVVKDGLKTTPKKNA